MKKATKKLVKKIVFITMVLMMLVSLLLPSFAARAETSDTPSSFVEFKALVPDDFDRVITILFTNHSNNTVKTYYLYQVNDYISNEKIEHGKYSVSVAISTVSADMSMEDEFNYLFDTEFEVVESNNALEYELIIDKADMVGDSSGDGGSELDTEGEGLTSGDVPSTDVIDEGDEPAVSDKEQGENDSDVASDSADTKDKETDKETDDSEKRGGSLLRSAIVSVGILCLGGAVAWFITKKTR